MKVKGSFYKHNYLAKFDISSFRVVEDVYISNHNTMGGSSTEKDIDAQMTKGL